MTARINPVQVSQFITPLIRPLVSVFTIYNSMEKEGWAGIPPEQLRNDLISQISFLSKSVDYLQERVDGREAEYDDVQKALGLFNIFNESPVDTYPKFNQLSTALSNYTQGIKRDLSLIYNKAKAEFQSLYSEVAPQSNIVLFHGVNEELAVSSIAKTLSNACFYNVDLHQADSSHSGSRDVNEVLALYSADANTINKMLNRKSGSEIDILLSSLPKDPQKADITLSKTLYLLQIRQVHIVYRPFPAVRLLHSFEQIRTRKILNASVEGKHDVGQKGEFYYKSVRKVVRDRVTSEN